MIAVFGSFSLFLFSFLSRRRPGTGCCHAGIPWTLPQPHLRIATGLRWNADRIYDSPELRSVSNVRVLFTQILLPSKGGRARAGRPS